MAPAGGGRLAGPRPRAGPALRHATTSRPARAGAATVLAPEREPDGCSTCASARRRGAAGGLRRRRLGGYANVQLGRRQEVFESGCPRRSTGTSWTVVRPHEEALEPRPTPDEPPLRKLARLRRTAAARRQGGGEAPARGPLRGGPGPPVQRRPPGGCSHLARCNIGCPRHAKNTVDVTYSRAQRGSGPRSTRCTRRCGSSARAPAGGLGFRDLQYRARAGLRLRCWCSRRLPGPTACCWQPAPHRAALPRSRQPLLGNGDALGVAFDRAPPAWSARRRHRAGDDRPARRLEPPALLLADGALPRPSPACRARPGGNALTGWRRQLLRLRRSESSRLQRLAGHTALGAAGQVPPITD